MNRKSIGIGATNTRNSGLALTLLRRLKTEPAEDSLSGGFCLSGRRWSMGAIHPLGDANLEILVSDRTSFSLCLLLTDCSA
jgi:hypothetical protein